MLSAYLERDVRYFRNQKKGVCLQIDKSIRNKNRERKEYFIKAHKMVEYIDLRVR